MESSELLTLFNGHLDSYSELRGYIDRAKAQEGKFSLATIERVVLKNEVKSQEVGDQIRPLVPEIEAVLLELTTEIDAIKDKKSSADEEMEELQLRQIIGELTDEEFAAASAKYKGALQEAEQRIGELAQARDAHQAALDRWVEMAVVAGHDTGLAADADPGRDEAADEPEVDEARETGEVYQDAGGQVEDLSELFPTSGSPAQAEPEVFEAAGEEISIEVGGGDEEAEIDVEVGFSGADDEIEEDEPDEVEEDISDDATPESPEQELQAEDDGFMGGDEDALLGGEGEEEVEIDLMGGGAAPEDDLGLDLSDELAGGGAGQVQRRALLIYQEGTAEEQIYPFTGDQITVGRGRDNDIQIKNDSKVSRYHCKVFRRGDNFYIEDNKSSNGSLVNGELVTERRLFGGEEIIIGETFFRFRFME